MRSLLPVVVLAEHADDALGGAALKAGAQEYLVKGTVSAELLGKVVSYAIERHSTQEQLRKSEQFFRSSLDSLSTHIAILEPGGRIVEVNRAWLEFAEANGAEKACVSTGLTKPCAPFPVSTLRYPGLSPAITGKPTAIASSKTIPKLSP